MEQGLDDRDEARNETGAEDSAHQGKKGDIDGLHGEEGVAEGLKGQRHGQVDYRYLQPGRVDSAAVRALPHAVGADNASQQRVDHHEHAVVKHDSEQRGQNRAVDQGHLGVDEDAHDHGAGGKRKQIKIIVDIDIGKHRADVVGDLQGSLEKQESCR